VHAQVLAAINQVCSQFKFVVISERDIDEIEAIYLPHVSRDKIILMPQGITPLELNENALRVVETAKERGYRLLTRLQVEIWGAERRV